MTEVSLAERHILVVEDDYFAMRDLCAGLDRLGATVVGPVPTVAEALALVASAPHIDAAVLDINIRGEVVYPVADALTARGVPFIFSTGYSDDVVAARYRHVAHCEKPVDVRRVEEALATELDVWQLDV